jgi:alpha-D-ribose 1-methylphosphonate 5-triphosphate synthase subunit PhnG
MKRTGKKGQRKAHIAAVFDTLTEQNKAYIEALTAQLAEIHETAPVKQEKTRKAPNDRLKLKKGID